MLSLPTCSLGVSAIRHSRDRWWLASLEPESDRLSDAPVMRMWMDSKTWSAMATNSMSVGSGVMCSIAKHSASHMVLHKPKGSTVGGGAR